MRAIEFVIDVDDFDRLIERVRSRAPTLVLIEDKVLKVAPHWRKKRSEDQGEDIGQSDDQYIETPLPPVAQTRPYRAKRHRTENRVRVQALSESLPCYLNVPPVNFLWCFSGTSFEFKSEVAPSHQFPPSTA